MRIASLGASSYWTRRFGSRAGVNLIEYHQLHELRNMDGTLGPINCVDLS